MFAQPNQKVKKPTAKVKPLKCSPPADDFVTPHPTSETNTTPGGGHRMGDLDIISVNDPLPGNRPPESVVINEVQASSTPVAVADILAANPKKTGKKRKKNKGGQEANKDTKPTEPTKDTKPVPQNIQSSAGNFDSGRAKEKELPSKVKQDVFRADIKSSKEKEVKKATRQNSHPEVKANVKSNGTKQEQKSGREDRMKNPKILQRPKQPEPLKTTEVKQILTKPPQEDQRQQHLPQRSPEKPKEQPQIRILKTQGPSTPTTATATQATVESLKEKYMELYDHEVFGRLAESTEKLLQTVLSETEVIKSSTEQISKDLKTALEKCKESSLSLSDLEKINFLLSAPMGGGQQHGKHERSVIDTSDLERQVESAKREAQMLEARLNDVIRKNMSSDGDEPTAKEQGRKKK